MKPDIVVDIGNTRVKFGRCMANGIEMIPLPPDEAVWSAAVTEKGIKWAVAGVHPERIERFKKWVASRGEECLHISDYRQLPLKVDVPEPEKVGIDRLLGCVSANAKTRREFESLALVIDAGTAITINFIDKHGSFVGGTISPGIGMMRRALHEFTAKLPFVEPGETLRPPGRNTADAIRCGTDDFAVGGIERILNYWEPSITGASIFITGGDAAHILKAMPSYEYSVEHVPTLNLEGLRIASEALS